MTRGLCGASTVSAYDDAAVLKCSVKRGECFGSLAGDLDESSAASYFSCLRSVRPVILAVLLQRAVRERVA
jgi:hypothetical protein